MLLTRTTLVRQSLIRSPISRGVHIENTLYNNMPFSYRNKKAFAVKLILFMGTGFAIPFVASAYQLKKSAASA